MAEEAKTGFIVAGTAKGKNLQGHHSSHLFLGVVVDWFYFIIDAAQI